MVKRERVNGWAPFGASLGVSKRQSAKCQRTARTTTRIADKAHARTRTRTHAHCGVTTAYYTTETYAGLDQATGRGKYGKHTGPGRSTGKKIDTSPFWCNEPPVRDIATTKEKDHITLHRHLRKRLDFYPGEARARRYNTGPPPVPPDMAGGLSAFAVQ